MEPSEANLKIQDLDHCGIVAGIIDQLGLVELINRKLLTHPQEIVSAGVGVKAMILNGLGLVSAPLYLFEQFFVGKATEHLLGEGIKPEHLNDDKLGRILDQLNEVGLTQLYIEIALAGARHYQVETKSLHLDSRSMSVHGKYMGRQTPASEAMPSIAITHGYSRDHRPDLKQFMVDLMCSGDGDVPLYLRVADGNESDQAIFAQLIREFRQQWQEDALFVADAALYSQENLHSLQNLSWLCRVPGTLKETQQLKQQLPPEAFVEGEEALEGYRWSLVCSRYGDICQRWLVIEVVSCAYYHHSGRPKKGSIPDGYRYYLSAQLTLNHEVVSRLRTSTGRFVLATNVLDQEQLTDKQMLAEYKGQQATERGFRFLKDPLFLRTRVLNSVQHRELSVTSSVFLKTPRRVAALAMVMGLCLLVYTLAQRALRQALAQAQEAIPNQLGKPTATPTMRWVFQCFQSIHWVCLHGVEQIINLREEHRRILRFLGSPCQQYYLLV